MSKNLVFEQGSGRFEVEWFITEDSVWDNWGFYPTLDAAKEEIEKNLKYDRARIYEHTDD